MPLSEASGLQKDTVTLGKALENSLNTGNTDTRATKYKPAQVSDFSWRHPRNAM
jgi:hypothetical protein